MALLRAKDLPCFLFLVSCFLFPERVADARARAERPREWGGGVKTTRTDPRALYRFGAVPMSYVRPKQALDFLKSSEPETPEGKVTGHSGRLLVYIYPLYAKTD